MPILNCAWCGDVFAAKSKTAKYCNISCYNKARAERYYSNSRLQREQMDLDSCQYNSGVSCVPMGDCSKCGWNPEVARKRFERILARLLGAEEVLKHDS